MFFKSKRKTLALSIFLILIVLSVGYNHDIKVGINSVFATPTTLIASQIRGDTYNDTTLTNGQHVWTGGLEPYTQASNGTFLPYVLSQNATHYIVDNKEAPFIINKNNCITSIYDNSVPLSQNPASIISKEWWDVSFHTVASPLFTNMDLSSTSCTISVTTNSSGIFIDTLKAFPAGTLEVIYEKIIGKNWETILIPTNMLSASNYYIKPIERTSEINADSIVVGKTSFTGNAILSSQINQSSSTIAIIKGSKSFIIDENNALTNFKQLNITKTSSGFSLSTDFGSNIPSLSTNQKFTIDPTFGWQNSSWIRLVSAQTSGTTCSTTQVGSDTVSHQWVDTAPSSLTASCAGVAEKFSITGITLPITVTSTQIKFDTGAQFSGTTADNCDFSHVTVDPLNSTKYQQAFTDIISGSAYVANDPSCSVASRAGNTVTLGSTANTDFANSVANGFYTVGIRDTHYNSRNSNEYTTQIANAQLQIVYSHPPVAPTGLTTPTQSTTGITPRWNSVTGATWYLVYKASPVGANFTQIANVTTLTYSNTGLTAGTQYNYKVSAGNSSGKSPASAPSSNYTNLAINATTIFNSRIILNGNITAPNGICIGAC